MQKLPKLDPRLEKMVKFLTEDHLETVGGYPYDWDIIGKRLIIAGLDPGKDYAATSLSSFRVGDVLKWHDRAMLARQKDDLTWEEACYETWPENA